MTKKNTRPSWDEYFIKIAHLVAERSTCLRHNVGAVLVKDKQILSTGYNGAATKIPDCLELGCLRDAQKIPSGQRHEICSKIVRYVTCRSYPDKDYKPLFKKANIIFSIIKEPDYKIYVKP
ncbi:MAG: hypothetical protein COX44_00400 [Candidatus Portnoybacteria bacterium CG23_combo_of_CG06-09_8_20_14_all_37_13]|uniref:CMP/dCMP-type deaminase domain-containing protein n=1 Tax=Candidatus Portnoybacteria bacterium CG23_combo_of_CG06-09_8_20_14_all_37_13 TaxID=1974819 RepID=A0A2G9YDM7_9BACT|nr:MAG: hypothetical protein COX44_00400 [Candidatus Portnoybacteria bacterium CG23_combo_of_CG06-09_8_20_14_all_37_13]